MYPISQSDWDRYQTAFLDHGLNVAVLTIARQLFPAGFDVSDKAPGTYEELIAQFNSGGRYVVYSGGAHDTIFGDRDVNYHFRAWHDWCHWRGRYDFSLCGEYGAYKMQCTHLVARYGDNDQTQRWRQILLADVIGQKLYWKRCEHFPDNQMAFVKAYLARLDAYEFMPA